jgi:hypothetical protein
MIRTEGRTRGLKQRVLMFRSLDARGADERLCELEPFHEVCSGPRHSEYGELDERVRAVLLLVALRHLCAFDCQSPSPEPGRMELFYTGSARHHLLNLGSIKVVPEGRPRIFSEYEKDWPGRTLADGGDPPVWLSGWLGQREQTV